MEHEKENIHPLVKTENERLANLRAQKATGEGNVPETGKDTSAVNQRGGEGITESLPEGAIIHQGKVILPGEPVKRNPYPPASHNLYEMPPCNIDAEKSVIGGILIDTDAGERTDEVLDLLDPNDFYGEPYKAMFRVLRSLRAEGQPTNDPVVFRSAVAAQKLTQECGGDATLLAVLDFVPTAANLLYYARIVSEKATLRRTREAGGAIVALTHDTEKSGEEIADEAERLLLGATEGHGMNASGQWVSAGEANDELLIELIERAKGNTRSVKSGLLALDKILQGFRTAALHIIAARPAMGKTGLATTIGDLMADRGLNVAFFTMEMTNTDVAERRLAKFAQINSRKFAEPSFTPDEKKAIKEATEKIRKLPFYSDDEATLTVRAMRTRLRRVRAKLGGLDFVIIDYIQLASGESARAQKDKRNEVLEVTRGLKALAKEFKVPILALAQLNRDCEKREDKRPMLSDLAESGQLEAEAWSVTFLYRASYYDHANPVPAGEIDKVEAIVAKNRSGLTRTATLGFRAEYTQFVDLDETGRPILG